MIYITSKNVILIILRTVYEDNQAWAIQNIVFENVNIVVEKNKNEDETSISGNLFFNGGRGSVIAQYGEKLYIGMFVFQSFIIISILSYSV